MDPFRNSALQSAKLQALLSSTTPTHRPDSHISSQDMPAPPAYHMVVDPNTPIPNAQSPYEHEHDEEEEEEKEEETPEITVNAATQVRGHGNIISIAQMDSVRIASLIATLLNDGKVPENVCPPTPPTTETQSTPSPPSTTTTTIPATRQIPRINITVNCGATIIGDRNIVGPGLGDIARQMQVAQRNQAALQAQRQQQQQSQQPQQQAGGDQKISSPSQRRETLYQAQAAIAQHHGMMWQTHAPSPPMSRTSSFGSEGLAGLANAAAGVKRKAEAEQGACAKKQC